MARRSEARLLRGADSSENTTRSRGNALREGGIVLTDPKEPAESQRLLELVVQTQQRN